MVDTQPPPRRSRLVYLLILFATIAFCGLVFQWVNYRIVKVVDDYESRRVHLSKIRPARPLWTKEEWDNMPSMKERKKKIFKSTGIADGDSADESEFGIKSMLKRKDGDEDDADDDMFKPEVVKAKAQMKRRKWSTLKGTKEPRQLQLKSTTRLPSEDDSETEADQDTSTVSLSQTTFSAASVAAPTMQLHLKSTTPMSVEETSASMDTLTNEATSNPTVSDQTTYKIQQSSIMPVSSVKPETETTSTSKIEKETAKFESAWNSSSNLLDIAKFTWIMNNESLCKLTENNISESANLLSILVHSGRSHFNSRQAIRDSWGSIQFYKNWHFRLVFLLGDARLRERENETIFQEQQKKLQAEQEKYGDLVMGSFVDSEKNQTYKHLMGYKWILNFCQNANYVLKVNDNMFVHIMKWVAWINADLEFIKAARGEEKRKVPDLYCKLITGSKASRKGRFKVSKTEWSLEVYPDYCCPWTYGASIDALKKLYSVSNNVKYFWRDDVFVTGVLRKQAQELYGWKPEVKDISPYVSPKLNVTHLEKIGGLCKQSEWKEKWPFHPITYLQRGERLQRDMKCLWDKIVNENKSNNDRTVNRVKNTETSTVKYSTTILPTTSESAKEDDEEEEYS